MFLKQIFFNNKKNFLYRTANRYSHNLQKKKKII